MNGRAFLRGLLCACVVSCCAYAQQPDTVRQKGELPHLEIPEITIVGKKAITLPFARKGEIYDVELFDAPPADPSLLGTPPSMSLLKGSLPRYRQEEMPWRFSAEALAGSFGTLSGRGYLHYVQQQWGADGSAGFKQTNGHTGNADASSFALAADAYTLVRTDNDALRTFRASLGASFDHDSYGLFGIPTETVRRRNNVFALNAGLGSVNRRGTVVDIGLGASFGSLNDAVAGIDSSVSSVSPDLSARVSTAFRGVDLAAGVGYRSSSLEYAASSPSPSMVDLSVSARWKAGSMWTIEAGGRFAQGEDNLGEERTLAAPFGAADLALDSTFSIRFWFTPEMAFTPYNEYLRRIPYLVREFTMEPERRPVTIGSSFFYNRGALSLEVRGTFAHSTNAAVELADSGRIDLAYVDAARTTFAVEGSVQLTNISRILFSGSLTGAFEKDSSSQLPMVPVADLRGRWETDFRVPVKAWSSVEYLSKRNVDRAGRESLGDVFLVNVGASTNAVARLVIAAEVKNLFDVGYEWWRGYAAPGIEFNVSAKFSLQ